MARRIPVLAFLACAATAVPARVEAADSPTEKLVSEWSRASDEARTALLDAATVPPSREAIDAVVKAARTSIGVRKEAERLGRVLAAKQRELKELGADASESDARVARDRADAADMAKQADREDAAVAGLASVVGRVLDALPEADATTAVKDLLAAAPDPALPGFRAFTARAIGSSRLVRTSIPLIDTAAEARKEIVKAQGQRAEPARKLDEVIKKLNDAVDRYLKAARAKGDDSGMVPVGLVGKLPEQKDELQAQVNRLGAQVDAADDRRRTAREALSRALAGMAAADADHVLDMMDSRLFRAEDVDDRAFGYLALGGVAGPRPLAVLSAAADGKDPRDAAAAIEALGERSEPEIVSIAAKHLADEDADWRVRTSAAATLARTGRAVAVPPLIDAMKTAKGRLLDDLREALIVITGEKYPANEAPWRSWWDVIGKDFRGPKDPKPAVPPSGPAAAPGAKPPASSVPGAADDTFQFYGIESHSTRVLYVLDYSGSMNFAGSEADEKVKKIDVLRKEMKKSLAGLPDGSTFNVIAFSSDVRPWKPAPQVRSVKSAAEALLWVEKAQADGGTNIGDVLEAAFKMMGAGLQKDRSEAPAFDTVFFMTDGKPSLGKMTDTKQILAAVRRWNEGRKVRIHVVGMGGHGKPKPKPAGPAPRAGGKPQEDDLDEEFLKDLAAQNGGQCVIH